LVLFVSVVNAQRVKLIETQKTINARVSMTEPSGEFKESQKVFIAQGMIREVRK